MSIKVSLIVLINRTVVSQIDNDNGDDVDFDDDGGDDTEFVGRGDNDDDDDAG